MGTSLTAYDVAVVMATFNGEAYVEEQLRSILDQSRRPDILVISDDGSMDATLRLCEATLAQSGLPYNIEVNSHRLGYAENFRQAALSVNANWILFSDQDDSWMPDKIETLLKQASESNALVFVHDLEFCDENLQPLEGTLEERLAAASKTPDSFEKGCCMMARGDFTRFCLALMPPGESHDSWLSKAALYIDRRVFLLGRRLIRHRVHSGQVSGRFTKFGRRERRRTRQLKLKRFVARLIAGRRRHVESLRRALQRHEALIKITEAFADASTQRRAELDCERLRRRVQLAETGSLQQVRAYVPEIIRGTSVRRRELIEDLLFTFGRKR